MAFTAEQLATLEVAFMAGEKRVTIEGKSIEYHDLDQMWRAILVARADVAASTGAESARVVRTTFAKGT